MINLIGEMYKHKYSGIIVKPYEWEENGNKKMEYRSEGGDRIHYLIVECGLDWERID